MARLQNYNANKSIEYKERLDQVIELLDFLENSEELERLSP
jgi:hypothetical protein